MLSISVKIFDDEIPEPPELFYGHLHAATLSPNIQLKPVRTVATIIDNEGVWSLFCVKNKLQCAQQT